MLKYNNILGQYDYLRYPSVNVILDHEGSIDKTVIHEYAHMMLTQKTTYGVLCYLLKRIDIIDDSYTNALKFFIKNSRNVQEVTATFIEFCSIYITCGEDTYLNQIRTLKDTNEEYYKYLNQLLFITHYSKDFKRNIEFALSLGLIAMSPDILKIPTEIINNDKERKFFFRDGDNCKEFLADRRFKTILKIAESKLKEEGFTSNILNSITRDFNEVIAGIDDDEFLRNIKEYFLKIYSTSNDIEIIGRSLESLEIINSEDFDASIVVPTNYSFYNMEQVEYSEFKIKDSLKYGVLLLLVDVAKANKPIFMSEEEMQNIKSIVKDNQYASIYIDYKNKINYSINLDKKQIDEILESAKSPIVATYDFYRKTLIEFMKVKRSRKRRLYVYSDNSYNSLKTNLDQILNSESKARIIEYPNMHILIVKLKYEVYYIHPVINTFAGQLIKDLKEGTFNIKLADNKDGRTLVDEEIIRSQNDLDEIDFIINCIYNTK